MVYVRIRISLRAKVKYLFFRGIFIRDFRSSDNVSPGLEFGVPFSYDCKSCFY